MCQLIGCQNIPSNEKNSGLAAKVDINSQNKLSNVSNKEKAFMCNESNNEVRKDSKSRIRNDGEKVHCCVNVNSMYELGG